MASSSPAVSSPPARRPLTDSVYRFMHRAPRCRARTRRGSLCQSPAMINGRCRMQGGTSPGAPMGNKNAFKHGRYTADAIASRRSIAELIRNARQVCTRRNRTCERSCGIRVLPSRPGEFHPEPLTEPDLTLSRHPARATARRLPPSIEHRVPPVAG
jgi:hypothetical protein